MTLVINKSVKSCGCLRNRLAPRVIHGASYTRTYKSWKSMRNRCLTPTSKDYQRYGGRGISICERWESFENFLADMGERPAGKTLGRIENNGDYEPGNCRWETDLQQLNNRRSSRVIEHGGERKTLAEWARHAGISDVTLAARLARGWRFDRAISQSVRQQKNNTFPTPASVATSST